MRPLPVFTFVFLILLNTTLPAGDKDKFSGLVFGDYYWFASHQNDDVNGDNGFQIRRVYFTYDRELDDTFSMRFRIEMNSAGVTNDNPAKLEPFIKDIYLRWRLGKHNLQLGITPTPTYAGIEKLWGYRFIEQVPTDLYRLGSTRDLGISLAGTLDKNKRWDYHIMVGNGNSVGQELDDGKKTMFSTGYKFGNNFLIRGFFDWNELSGQTDRFLAQSVIGYEKPDLRAAIQYAYETRESGEGQPNRNLHILSTFVTTRLTDKFWGIARFERAFNPNPAGAKMPYHDLATDVPFFFILAGLDILAAKHVHFIPNLEMFIYDEKAGQSLRNVILPRITFYYNWN